MRTREGRARTQAQHARAMCAATLIRRTILPRQLPREMRVQLREFFHHRYRSYENAAQHTLFDQMSPKLQGEVLLSCNEKILRSVWFLKEAASPTLVEVALSLTPILFTPGEHLPSEHLYIIHRGTALYRLRVRPPRSCSRVRRRCS